MNRPRPAAAESNACAVWQSPGTSGIHEHRGSSMRLTVVVLLLLTLLTLGACSTPPPAPVVSERRVYIPIDRIHQEANLCVPTSAAMVLAYFGDPRSPRELKAYSRGRDYDPKEPFNDFTQTYYRDMVAGMRKAGYSWAHRNFPDIGSG